VTIILAIILFAVFSLLGLPLAIGLGASTLITIITSMDMSMSVIAERLLLGVDSFTLLAVPLFIFAAGIMNRAGVTTRMFNFARVLVGSLPGSLGHANIIASIIFSGISGSAVADSAALGAIEIKAMEDQGYPKKYAAAITCASATIGPIIPPSIPMVIYAGIASASVGKLFLGGVVPGLLIGITLMVMNHIISIKNNYPGDNRYTIRQVLKSFIESFLPVLTPVLIVGGILMGVFTPTEAAAFTVFYAFVLGFFIYKEFKFNMLPEILFETVVTSSIVMFILASAAAFSWILTVGRLGDILMKFANTISSPLIFLAVINIALIILGMFMETTAVLIIMTPFFLIPAHTLGIDITHLGVMIVLNLMIGLSTPPFGLGLFTVSKVAKIKIEEVVVGILPFIPVLFIVLILIILFPQLVLWFPSLFF